MRDEIIAGNKLIAKYMGGQPYGDGSTHFSMPSGLKTGHSYLHSVSNFHYHESWDMLMPVWAKLQNEDQPAVELGLFLNVEKEGQIRSAIISVDIRKTWTAIVDMLNWLDIISQLPKKL